MYKVQELAHLNSFMLLWFTAFERKIQGFLFLSGKKGIARPVVASRTCMEILIITWEAPWRCHILQLLILWLISAFYGITSVVISVNSYVFLMLLVTTFLRREKKIEHVCLIHFRRRIFNRSFFEFFCLLLGLICFEEFTAHVRALSRS